MSELTDQEPGRERALLVGVQLPGAPRRDQQPILLELQELCENLEIEVAAREWVRLRKRRARFLLGPGKVADLIDKAHTLNCTTIVFDEELSPGQQRNWERESNLRVIDRQEVILDIFAERAKTREAEIQIELARNEYLLPRLTRAWTHLSRQRGGRVTQRGEGEAQIELDQRMLRTRIARLKRNLDKVVQKRNIQRARRMRVPVPNAAIVGYTNVGKSLLLNTLTRAEVLVEDKLFATLDPTTRRLSLPSGQHLVLSDTVGFVRRLPHGLVEAFKSTLEEAVLADFLIHVVDISNPQADVFRETTLQVLRDLGADTKNVLTVLNKADLISPARLKQIEAHTIDDEICVSLVSDYGLDRLRLLIDEFVGRNVTPMSLLIPHNRYDLINRLYRSGSIERESARAEGVLLAANVPPRLMQAVRPFDLDSRTLERKANAEGEVAGIIPTSGPETIAKAG